MYQIIFSDIDGTLLTSNHQLSTKTKSRIQSLSIPFVLVSARMPQGIYPFVKQLKLHTPMICYSGGLILDQDHHILYQSTFEEKQAETIYHYIKSFFNNICVTRYSLNQWLVDNIDDPWVQQEKEITSINPSILNHNQNIYKFLCMSESNHIIELEKVLSEQFPEVMIYRSKDTYLEIMPKGVSKSKAISIVCDYYQISLEQAIGFGDNYNDLEMLQTVKMGILMGNAPKELKQKIPHHTTSNDENGIVVALDNLKVK